MNIYFSTRKEARSHCKSLGIPFTRIFRDSTIVLTWGVRVDEANSFVVGKTYKIVDETGFLKSTSMYSSQNTANSIQLQQIKKHCPDGVKIVSIDGNGNARFEDVVGVSFRTFKSTEIQFMAEVVAPVAVAVTAVGSVTTTEEKPDEWVKGKKYIFAPDGAEKMLKTSPISSNKNIVEYINAILGGVITIEAIDVGNKEARFEVVEGTKINGTTGNVLFYTDREFFEEAVEVNSDTPTLPEPEFDLLDAELDGGEPALPKELDPTKWVDGREYILTNEAGFIDAHASNADIVAIVNNKFDGVVTAKNIKTNGSFYMGDSYFRAAERVYFTEIDSVTVTPGDKRQRKIGVALRSLSHALEVQKNATVELEKANKAVYDAYDVLKAL